MSEKSPAPLLLICRDPKHATKLCALLNPFGEVRTARPHDDLLHNGPDNLVLFAVQEDGPEDLRLLGEWIDQHPEVAVVALVERELSELSADVIVAGATSWLPISMKPDELRRAIHHLAARSRRRAQREARRERAVNLIEKLPVGVFELTDGCVSYVNQHLLRRLGYGRDEIIGKRPEELDLVIPQERARLAQGIDQQLRGNPSAQPGVYQFAAREGNTYVGEIVSWLTETPDGPVLEGAIQDITQVSRMTRLQSVVIELGEVILGESDIGRILQLVLDTITEYSGFRRAVLSLYDLSAPVPFEAEVHTLLTSGLDAPEQEAFLEQPTIPPMERRLVFSDRYRLGPAYYVPHDDVPWTDSHGIHGSLCVEGWHADDFLFIPLRGTSGIIGSISVDDPVDRSAPTIASIEPVAALANLAALAIERVYKMQQLRKQKERLHVLSVFGEELAQVTDVRTLCELAVRHVQEDMDYGVCAVFLEDGMRLVLEAVTAKDLVPDNEIPTKGTRIPVDGPGITRWVFREAKTAIIPDILKDERHDATETTLRSFMAIPIMTRKGIIGVLDVASERSAAFDAQDLEVVSTLAGQLSTAISALRRRDALLRIYSFGQRLATASARDRIVASTLDFLVDQFDFELNSIILARDDNALMVAGLRGPYHQDDFEVGSYIPIDEGLVGWVATNRRPALVPDVTKDARYVASFPATRSELVVPILFSDNLLGVINVESRQTGFFDDEDRQLLEVVANHCAIALSNVASQETLREQAVRDPLTGLFNRHYFNSIIASELSRADRYDRPMTLMMIDIDGFRAVNNTFGHLKGDDVLREIAQMLEQSVRDADSVIRYGGDEFLILMPETNGKGDAEIVGARLRTRIKQIPEKAGIAGHQIDLSVGLYARMSNDGRSLEELLEEVDRRMYDDKRAKHAAQD